MAVSIDNDSLQGLPADVCENSPCLISFNYLMIQQILILCLFC